MIEVTQRNVKGNEQSLGIFTEDEFGEFFWPDDIKYQFANSSIERRRERIYLPTYDTYVTIPVFSKVAYNEKGRLLTTDYLLGISYKYQAERWGKYRGRYNSWAKSNYHRGCSMRRMHTTQERRWAHAWDDEEFAPNVRARRSLKGLPHVWDDYWRYNTKNWKNFRNFRVNKLLCRKWKENYFCNICTRRT